MTENYTAWDNTHTQVTSACNVNIGELAQNIAPCMNPALDDTGPYLVCVAADGGAYLLIHLPDGAKLPFLRGAS